MEEELNRYIQVWVSAVISVCYCYYLPSRIKPGVLRLLCIVPVCVQFFVFPMLFSSSTFIFTIMFFLTVLGTFKLILFSFDKGPLFPLPLNLFHFICFTCFPIMKLKESPRSKPSLHKSIFTIKVGIFGVLFLLQDYIKKLPPIWLLVLHPLYTGLRLGVLLTFLKILLTNILGCELEPAFDEPYLATSLQDFSGRRWNIMVSSVFRSAIYVPTRDVFKRKPGLANFLGCMATFIFSGLFHELQYFYVTRVTPSGGITLFYVLHGVCTATEVAVKKTAFARRWALRPAVSWLLTMSFLVVTSGWLYFPQIYRGDTYK